MKILKIFGLVVAVHLVAFLLIFVNPGCQSKSSPAPAPATTTAAPSPASVSFPGAAPAADSAPLNNSALNPAVASDAPAAGGLFSPTRPDTPLAQALTAAPATGVTPAATYTVVRGDSLWEVAHKHHLTVVELAKANNLGVHTALHVGQKLIIPGAAAGAGSSAPAKPAAVAKAESAPPAASAGEVIHVVKAGETLGAIARHYQVKIGVLATANNISDPAKIHAGQKLIIPGYKAVGKTAAASAPSAAPAPAPEPAPAGAAPAPAPVPASGAFTPPVISSTPAPAPAPAASPDGGSADNSGSDNNGAPVIQVNGGSAPQLN